MTRGPVSAARSTRGFSLVEVLVSLVVVSIGLLGLAKMESLALVSTNVASTRSIAAIQAASLAAAMHADRAYWGSGRATVSTIVTADRSGAVTITDTGPASGLNMALPNCTIVGTTACTVDQMAAYDVQNWAKDVGVLLPPYNATITCNTTGMPVNCTIVIRWAENAVAATSQQTNLTGLQQPTYTLYVEP